MALAQITHQQPDEVIANTARMVEFRCSSIRVLLICGKADPDLYVSVAPHIQSQGKNVSLHAIDAGHWPQIDAPDDALYAARHAGRNRLSHAGATVA
ncbi:MAG TPA: hypothetical protein VMJ11_30480 [Paraburkholderia sp.]|uniref:alpha/beta fold hydrolase n=1 Tax=Paraburkholderia sp. TaxID=1926495 RepID=UPI002CB78B90|nr:hypothetical protein [Paraburkholderia sp.]HTR10903.1 hypothetical protein [Paraburkholderia sp.]